MKMLTKANRDALPALYSQESKGADALAVVKFFTPDSNWTWYATEYDPDGGVFFGLADGFEQEMGYFSLFELGKVRGALGLPVERDRYWKPKTLREIAPEKFADWPQAEVESAAKEGK